MLTEKDFYDYFAEETISIGFVSTQKPEEPKKMDILFLPCLYQITRKQLKDVSCSLMGLSYINLNLSIMAIKFVDREEFLPSEITDWI
jgi:hypothetical protein